MYNELACFVIYLHVFSFILNRRISKMLFFAYFASICHQNIPGQARSSVRHIFFMGSRRSAAVFMDGGSSR